MAAKVQMVFVMILTDSVNLSLVVARARRAVDVFENIFFNSYAKCGITGKTSHTTLQVQYWHSIVVMAVEVVVVVTFSCKMFKTAWVGGVERFVRYRAKELQDRLD
jgi:hypothetical protein